MVSGFVGSGGRTWAILRSMKMAGRKFYPHSQAEISIKKHEFGTQISIPLGEE